MDTATAKAIIERRQKLGITQTEVARRSGISQPTISDLEAGARPRNTTLAQLAKALECDPADLDPGYDPREKAPHPNQDGEYGATDQDSSR